MHSPFLFVQAISLKFHLQGDDPLIQNSDNSDELFNLPFHFLFLISLFFHHLLPFSDLYGNEMVFTVPLGGQPMVLLRVYSNFFF